MEKSGDSCTGFVGKTNRLLLRDYFGVQLRPSSYLSHRCERPHIPRCSHKHHQITWIFLKRTLLRTLRHSQTLSSILRYSQVLSDNFERPQALSKTLKHSRVLSDYLERSEELSSILKHSRAFSGILKYSHIISCDLKHSHVFSNTLEHSQTLLSTLTHSQVFSRTLKDSQTRLKTLKHYHLPHCEVPCGFLRYSQPARALATRQPTPQGTQTTKWATRLAWLRIHLLH